MNILKFRVDICEGVKNTRRGGLNCKTGILKQMTRYFYPGSFDLKLLQSTRSR